MISNLSTEQLARAIGVKPETIRTRLCRTGDYFGLRPVKLVNRRLIWPEDSLEQLKTNSGKRKAA